VLKSCSKFFSTNLRFCSSDSKFGTSNMNFPGFSTKGNFENFEKSPNIRTIASVILYRSSVEPKKYLFPDRKEDRSTGIETVSLLEGCLHAVEAVTQNISTENHEILDSLLTQDCLNHYEAEMPNKENLKHIGIDKEDVLFHWLGSFDEKAKKLRIGTLYFPSYHYLKQGMADRRQKHKDVINEVSEEIKDGQIPLKEGWTIKKERMKESESFDINQVQEHFDSNDIIVSNFDFVQEDGEWKIEGMVMQKLGKCLTPPFHWRWRNRAKSSIAFNKDFTRVILRWDYVTDYIFMTIVFNLLLLSTFAVPAGPS